MQIPVTCDNDLRRMEIADLVHFQGKFKTLHKDQYNKLKISIQEHGFIVPMFVWNDKILDGHQRLNVLKNEGWTVEGGVPVVDIDAENEADAAEKLLLLSSTYGKVDAQGLYEFTESKGLDLRDMPIIDLPDFDSVDYIENYYDKIANDKDPDNVPETPEIAISQTGDLWLLGEHRLLCGDATKKEDVERLMDGQKADMVFTDPPYGMDLDADYSKLPSTKKEGNKTYKPIIGDNKLFNYKLFNWLDCDEQIWFGANYYAKSIDDGGSWLVWDKREDVKFDKMFGSGFELAWSKSKHKQKIYRYNNTLFSGNEEARNKIHPTQKPTGLFVEIMNDFKAKNKVIDPFLGSGTTLIACEKTKRKCYGMELDPYYCDVIINRWQDYTGKQAISENGKMFDDTKQGQIVAKVEQNG